MAAVVSSKGQRPVMNGYLWKTFKTRFIVPLLEILESTRSLENRKQGSQRNTLLSPTHGLGLDQENIGNSAR